MRPLTYNCSVLLQEIFNSAISFKILHHVSVEFPKTSSRREGDPLMRKVGHNDSEPRLSCRSDLEPNEA
jgi:hypothetical protein